MRTDMIPLADRLRYSQLFRVVLAGLLLVASMVDPRAVHARTSALLPAIAVYLLAAAAGEAVWMRWGSRARVVFGTMLLVDGVFLAWVVQRTGSGESPLQFLTLAHVVITTLVASYRTGVKLAFWHSLLAFAIVNAEESGLVPSYTSGRTAGFSWLVMFISATWILAIATAAFSAVNERELRRRRFDLEELSRMTVALRKAGDPAGVADVLVEHLTSAFGFRRALVLVGVEGGLVPLAWHGIEHIANADPHGADPSVRECWHSGQPLLLSRFANDDAQLLALMPDARNVILAPLLSDGSPLGVVVVEHGKSSSARVEHRVVSIVRQFVADAALSLENVGLLQRITRMAETDGLTGVANRRTFDAVLESELARAARKGEPVSLVMLDIDHFKKLNDTHGHQTGDAVLRAVASALADHARGTDTVARYGGEEFALIVPGCPVGAAEAMAERFRRRACDADSTVAVTASAGVACFPDDGADPAALLRAADEALYAAKHSGRDRLVAAGNKAVGTAHRLPVSQNER